MDDKGHFENGVYYPHQNQPEEVKMIIKVEIEGYEEAKAKLKELIIDADLIRSTTERSIPPSQQRLEV